MCKYLHQLPDLPADLITAFSFIPFIPFQTSAQRRRRAAGRRARLWRRLLILYYVSVSDLLFYVSVSDLVHVIVHRVSNAIIRILRTVIAFPTGDDVVAVGEGFALMAGSPAFSSAVAIDGCHIRLKPPATTAVLSEQEAVSLHSATGHHWPPWEMYWHLCGISWVRAWCQGAKEQPCIYWWPLSTCRQVHRQGWWLPLPECTHLPHHPLQARFNSKCNTPSRVHTILTRSWVSNPGFRRGRRVL